MQPLLIFDYDGTLHNTMLLYHPAMRRVAQELREAGLIGEKDLSYEKVSSYLGMNVREMWESFAPELTAEQKSRASLQVGRQMLSAVREGKARWYDGAAEMLDQLADYPKVILSNSRRITGEVHFAAFGMRRWFSAWVDCESFSWAPKTEIIRSIAAEYGRPVIMIGDRSSDLEAARAVGAPFIGCGYGYGAPGELDGAEVLISREDPAPFETMLRAIRRFSL